MLCSRQKRTMSQTMRKYPASALIGALAQKRVHGLAFRDRVAWEFVAELAELEVQTRGEFDGIGDGFGQIGEKLRHFLGRFQVALGVAGEQASGGHQGLMVADGGEDVA
jgi:hypothetical protein